MSDLLLPEMPGDLSEPNDVTASLTHCALRRDLFVPGFAQGGGRSTSGVDLNFARLLLITTVSKLLCTRFYPGVAM